MRRLATLGLTAAAVIHASPAAAQDIAMEAYGTVMPFVENVGTTGATAAGTPVQNTMVASGTYTGINHERRFRMTSGTSHLGFRGDWTVAEDQLKLIWQIESPIPIDGEGPSNWAARNSHVGFSGTWGSLVYGNWDTPMRWVTVTSVNPIKGGYTGDVTAIIGAPGHSIPAWNSDQTFVALIEAPPNRAGFFRHEANSVQYWSPDIYGFSFRLMFATNEHRTAGFPERPGPDGTTIPATEQDLNPYLLSGYVGFDYEWLRLRYSMEVHQDYFGMSFTGAGPDLTRPNSTDVGHLALASVTINRDSKYKTRFVAVADKLSYHTDVINPQVNAFLNEFSRESIYGLVHQTVGHHNIWAAYGYANEGRCNVTGTGFTCTTTGLAAAYMTLGYMYAFSENTGIYGLGYGLFNDTSARYTPFPLLDSRAKDPSATSPFPNIGEIAPGADSIGVGIGFVHRFSVKIMGDKEVKVQGEAAGHAADKKKDAPVAKEKLPPPPPKAEPPAAGETKPEEEGEGEAEEAAPPPP